MCDCVEAAPLQYPLSGVSIERRVLDGLSTEMRMTRDWKFVVRAKLARMHAFTALSAGSVSYQLHSPAVCVSSTLQAEGHQASFLFRWKSWGSGVQLVDLDLVPLASFVIGATRLRLGIGHKGFVEFSTELPNHRRVWIHADCRARVAQLAYSQHEWRVLAEASASKQTVSIEKSLGARGTARLWLGRDILGMGLAWPIVTTGSLEVCGFLSELRHPKLSVALRIVDA
jgi:hypothetical protein